MYLFNIIKLIANHPLNRGHKLSSVIHFIKWQIGSRLVSGAIVYDWVNGSKFLVRNGETGLTGNIYVGLHEFPDMGFLLHFLRAEDLFVDIGANVGSYTILACAAVGSRGVAFEPVPNTYKRLVENVRLNHLEEKVKCINKGLGVQQGTITFTSDSDTMNHVLAFGEQCDNTINVEVAAVDTALQGELPSLIKIDVEGYETSVLNGSQKILNNQMLHAVIMELNGNGSRYGFDESQIIDLMYNYGFETFSYNPFSRTLINLNGKNSGLGNTLFIRNKSFVVDRLKTAPKVTVHGWEF
ncbi:MAG: FkbM family methyltransferase [Desulforhopalus sp.]|nr:FkbM family methyltransferase [Desulforhopalus sp.]